MVALIFSTYRAYKPTKAYGIFLSHHKMGAGSLARWFKIMLAQWIKDRIFLDSDDVNKLDAIMDVTAYDSDPWPMFFRVQTSNLVNLVVLAYWPRDLCQRYKWVCMY